MVSEVMAIAVAEGSARVGIIATMRNSQLALLNSDGPKVDRVAIGSPRVGSGAGGGAMRGRQRVGEVRIPRVQGNTVIHEPNAFIKSRTATASIAWGRTNKRPKIPSTFGRVGPLGITTTRMVMARSRYG